MTGAPIWARGLRPRQRGRVGRIDCLIAPFTHPIWQVLEGIATSLAAVFAAGRIFLSRRDANSRAVFEHLREIDRRVKEVWQVPIEIAQPELLAYYRKECPDLTSAARNYVALLNGINLLCFAAKRGLASKSVSSEYLVVSRFKLTSHRETNHRQFASAKR